MMLYIKIEHPYYQTPIMPVATNDIQEALEEIVDDDRVPKQAMIRIWGSEEDALTGGRPLLEVRKDEDLDGFLSVQPLLGVGVLPTIQQWQMNRGFLTTVLARHQDSEDDEGGATDSGNNENL